MFKKRFTPFIAVLLLTALLLVGCGDSQPSTPSLVGKWSQVTEKSVTGFGAKPGTTIQFFGDGNLDLGKYAGSYSVLDSTTMKIAIGGSGSALASMYTYTLAGDKLTILQKGETASAEYKRLP